MRKLAAWSRNFTLAFDVINKIQLLRLVARQSFLNRQKDMVVIIDTLPDSVEITMVNVRQQDKIGHQRFKTVDAGKRSADKLNLLSGIFKFPVDDQFQRHNDIGEWRAHFMLEILKDFPLQLFHILLGAGSHLFTSPLTRYAHAPQDGLDAGKQFLGLERFCDVIVGPIPYPTDTIFHA